MPRIERSGQRIRSRLPSRWLFLAAASAFLLVPGAALPLPVGNLLKNPGAEGGPGATSDTAVARIPGWTTSAGFTALRYGTTFAGGAFPDAPPGGGKNFFAGGPGNARSAARQNVDVSGSAAQIDGGGVTARLSALIGGYEDAADSGSVSATFRSAGGGALGKLTIGPVTAARRGGTTRLLLVSGSAPVPRRTRAIEVVMTAKRAGGSYNDAYFDNLNLTLSADGGGSSPPPSKPPPPPSKPPPGPPGDRATEPRFGKVTFRRTAALDEPGQDAQLTLSLEARIAANGVGTVNATLRFRGSITCMNPGQCSACPGLVLKETAVGTIRSQRTRSRPFQVTRLSKTTYDIMLAAAVKVERERTELTDEGCNPRTISTTEVWTFTLPSAREIGGKPIKKLSGSVSRRLQAPRGGHVCGLPNGWAFTTCEETLTWKLA